MMICFDSKVCVAALIASCACLLSVEAQTPRAPATASLTPALAAERKVGIAYSTWHNSRPWGQTWGTPALGQYLSNDPAVIRRHAEWLVSANVDFIYIDWSNDIDTGIPGAGGQGRQIYLEETTTALFEQYTRLPAHPQVAIMIGFPGQPSALSDGRLRRKADQVWETLAHHPKYEGIYFHYLHHPLLIIYTGTPTPFPHSLPPYSDPRFTVRFMTGFVSQQPSLLSGKGISRFGYWSWEDRGAPTVAADVESHADAMTVVPAWRSAQQPPIPAQGRNNGKTFRDGWARARALGPRIVLAGTFNEWSNPGEEPSAEVGKDIEPSAEFGTQYPDLLRTEAARFKSDVH
jgi:hypothetical protein